MPALGLLAIAALGVLWAVLSLLKAVGVMGLVTDVGAVQGNDPLLALVAGALVLTWGAIRLVGVAGPAGSALIARRARVLGLSAVTGLLVALGLLVVQLRAVDAPAYYFFKFCLGFELILAVVVPALVGWLLSTQAAVPGRAWRRVAVAVLATAAATQAFGAFPRGTPPLLDAGRSGTTRLGPRYSGPDVASGILRAVGSSTPQDAFRRDYLATGRGHAAWASYPDVWFHAVLGDSVGVRARDRVFPTAVRSWQDTGRATGVARRLLRDRPDVQVVLSPAGAEALRRRLGTPDLRRRVLDWNGCVGQRQSRPREKADSRSCRE